MEKKYKTAPLKIWGKAKEIRGNIYKEIAEAKSKGKLLVGGGAESLIALPTGFDHAFLVGEPYGASVAHVYKENPDLYMDIVEAAEHAGYPRDLCSYMRNYLGSLILDKYIFGGSFPHLDFCLQGGFCDTHSKWYQIVSELENIPYFSLDLVPFDWEDAGESETTKQLKRDYIDYLLDITGRDYLEDIIQVHSLRHSFAEFGNRLAFVTQLMTFVENFGAKTISLYGDLEEIQGEKWALVRIRDTGQGMTEEVRSRIFEPFFTTKKVGEGTGLGLAISFGIIQDHQGKIEVISQPGKGSEFIIYLPYLE